MAVKLYRWLHAAAAQLNAVGDRLPNAILIYGAPGTGLYELADWFAHSLLCEHPAPDGTPCGECAACGLLEAGTHPDYKRVLSEYMCSVYDVPYEPAENERAEKKKLSREVRIHQIRALSDFIGMNANRGGRRVVVIYPADMVRAEASAALLKSMEEPPKDLIYVLVAEDLDAVLPTIRSRARLMRVPLPDRDVSLTFLRAQGVASPEEALAMAGGAPLEALVRDPGLRMSPESEKSVIALLAKGPRLTTAEIIRGFPADFLGASFSLLLVRWSHDLMRAKMGLAPRYFIREAEGLKALSAQTSVRAIDRFDKDAQDVRRAAEHTLSPRQVWEAALMKYQAVFAASPTARR